MPYLSAAVALETLPRQGRVVRCEAAASRFKVACLVFQRELTGAVCKEPPDSLPRTCEASAPDTRDGQGMAAVCPGVQHANTSIMHILGPGTGLQEVQEVR